jgi:hypothetical protein
VEVTLTEARLESTESVLERNRQHYLFVCRKLNRYMSSSFRTRSVGQQPPKRRVLNLIREALRLNYVIYNREIILPTSLHATLLGDLETVVSNGSSESTKEMALRMAGDICSFVCEEVSER